MERERQRRREAVGEAGRQERREGGIERETNREGASCVAQPSRERSSATMRVSFLHAAALCAER